MDRYLVLATRAPQQISFIHTLFARQTQQELEYGLAEPTVDSLPAALRTTSSPKGEGCNVITFPSRANIRAGRSLSPRANGRERQHHQTDR